LGSKQIPGLRKSGWLDKKWVVEAISAGPPLFPAAYGAWAAYKVDRTIGIALGVAALWLGIAAAWKVLHARTQDASAVSNSQHDGLIGALHVLTETSR
jgi:hypothetical protein